MQFFDILNQQKNEKGITIHKVLKDGKEVKIKYAQVAAGLHWPEKNSPGFSVVIGELYSTEKTEDRKLLRGPFHVLAESEYQVALPVMFSKLINEIGLLGCSDIYCDYTTTGRREFADAFQDFRFKNKQSKGTLSLAPFPDNFSVGFHGVRYLMETGRLKAPTDSICYSQLRKIKLDDLKDPEVHLKFYALEALRFATTAMTDRTPKPYQKRSRRRRGRGWMVV